jgi:surface antigen
VGTRVLSRTTLARLGWIAVVMLAVVVVAAPAHAENPSAYGYPYPNAPDCNESTGANCVADRWSFFQGQCTSWVSYRINQLNHHPFNNFYLQPKGQRWGHATQWAAAADRARIARNGTPAVGAIAWYARGHVGYVEQLNGDGSVVMSEMNYNNHNAFRFRVIRPGSDWPNGFIHVGDRATSQSASDLAFVKWAPTGSGRIEVHTATAASSYAGFGIHAATPIAAGDTNGVFDMADVNGDGRADLVYIKRRSTGSGRIEIHWVNAGDGYRSFGGNLATVFSAAEDPNGPFEMADMNGDGRADLVFTKTRNTGSGRVELHWADAAGGYGRFGAHLVTAFSPADAGNGYFHPADMNADGHVDLAFVKIRNTGSGRIEVHWADAATGYGTFGGHLATALSGGERTNGWFETADMNGDRSADLVFLKDNNVGSGRIELHWLDARAGFSRITRSAATAFSVAEAGHGFFTIM